MQAAAPLQHTHSTDATTIVTDALIIGAGPVGIFQAFQLGLLGIHAHIVDALAFAGGQCVELYPDKLIYDIPGIPACTGRELVHNLLHQVEPFAPSFHFEQQVCRLERQSDERFLIETTNGLCFLTKTVLIAAGVGAFLPRTLALPGLNKLQHSQIAYRVAELATYANKRVVIFGDDDTALQWALQLSPAHNDGFPVKARSVTLVHRREQLQANAELHGTFKALVQAEKIRFYAGQVTDFDSAGDAIRTLTITQPDANDITLPADKLLVFWGLSPKLGPISEWGLAMERKQLRVNTETFETSEKGIFAVGDINTYTGKKKLILCGFHECTLAAFAAAAMIFPDKKIALQYTSSISPMQRASSFIKNA